MPFATIPLGPERTSKIYGRLMLRFWTNMGWKFSPVLALALTAGPLGELSGAAEERPAAPSSAPLPLETPKGETDPLPGEVKPEVYWLKDKDGVLRPVPGFSYEDFKRLYDLERELTAAPKQPAFTVRSVEITGTAGEQSVELRAQYEIIVHTAGWVRVPLRLAKAVLQEQPRFSTAGEHFVHFEDSAQGYILWLKLAPGQLEQVTLKLTVPLTHIGSEQQLALNTPRATTSTLTLDLPMAEVAARGPEGALLATAPGQRPGHTQLKLSGAAGQFEVSWRPPDRPVAVVPTVLEAMKGEILVRIDGRSVNSDAKLTVRSFGGPFDSFRVRLPKGAELVNREQAGLTIAPAVGAENSDLRTGKVVEIKLNKKTAGPVTVSLNTDRPYRVGQAGELLELAGFEVLGAARQWGNIAVHVEGDWQLVWGPQQNVRQIDVLPGALRGEDVTAGFEYFVQPCSLTAHIVPQKTRSSVEPQYVMLVDAERIKLLATFRYNVRGAKVRSLPVDLPGWEIDSIGPPSLVDSDALLSDDNSVIEVPLLQASSGQFDITIQASRRTPRGPALLQLELPQPRADAVGPADLVVSPANNVELVPQPDAMTSLHTQLVLPAVKLPEGRQQEPLAYRVESLSAGVRGSAATDRNTFVAALEVHPQSITVSASSRVELNEPSVQVRQKFNYLIAYEAVDHVTLEVPKPITGDSLTVTLDEQKLVPRTDPKGSQEKSTRISVGLPRARIGRFELEVGYSLPQERLLPSASVPFAVPLVMPAEGQLASNRVQVSSDNSIALTLNVRSGVWKVDEDVVRLLARPGVLSVSSEQRALELPLIMTVKEERSQEATIVDQAWIQTWLAGSGRQDRALYRVTTNGHELVVRLPKGASRLDAEVFVDNRPVAIDASGKATVPLRVSERQGEHLLELRYRFTDGLIAGATALSAPQLEPQAWIRRLYWQLILPSNEHVLVTPAGMSSESAWIWNRFFWTRQPALGQRELQDLLGARSGPPLPVGSNVYLYSTSGHFDELRCFTLQRSLIVGFASLVVLIVGLLLIYFPRMRHPTWLLLLGLTVIAVSTIAPDLAAILAQAASLGVVLVLLATLLARRPMAPPTPAPASVHGSSRATLDRSRTQLYPRSVKAGVETSTATAPVGLELPLQDSNA